MKIAHVILAHKHPVQVLRLVQRLAHPDVDCWVHIDGKCDVTDFRDILRLDNVYLVEPRVRVGWACYNIVQAMLNGMGAVLHSAEEYDYVQFLSGQDYPLQPPHRLLEYLDDHKGYEFVGNRPYEESAENIERVHAYHFNDVFFPGRHLFQRAVNRLLPRRMFPYDHHIRKGPQWMTLTTGALLYILKFVSDHAPYRQYFKMVHAPDEFFFQTILYNSPFREQMRNQIFHHIDWSQGMKNPKTFTIEDRECLETSRQLFARKFDMTVDARILDVLDKRILSRSLVK